MPYQADPPVDGERNESSPNEGVRDDLRHLTARERDTSGALARWNSDLAGLYAHGLALAPDAERPGHAYLLTYIGREVSRAVIRHLLEERGLDDSDVDHEEIPQREKHQPRGDDFRRSIGRALQLPPSDPRVNEWSRLSRHFATWEKYRYGGPPPTEVRDAFERLSTLLFGCVAPYYSTEARLDALLAIKEPTDGDAKRLRELQLRPGQRRYFFGQLDNGKWVRHLANEGFFENPPGRQVNEDGSWSPRAWAEGYYLVRAAPDAPADVAEVLSLIPATNDNPDVWDSVAKAASRLPPDLAADLVPRLTEALKSRLEPTFLTESVVALISSLAASGSRQACELADYLLYIESVTTADPADDRYRYQTGWAIPRFGGFDRQELMFRLVSALEGMDPEAALRFLLRKIRFIQSLVQALPWGLESKRPFPSAVESALLDALSDNGNDLSEHTVTMLARAAIGLAQRLAIKGPEDAARVVSLIEKCDGPFFVRLRYLVLSEAGHHLPDRLDDFLESADARDPGHQAVEVAAILRRQFGNASHKARKAYAEALEQGTARGDLHAALENWYGRAPTDDEIEDSIREWQRRILTFFRGDFPEELQPLAEKLGLTEVTPSFGDQQTAEGGPYAQNPRATYIDPARGPNLHGWSVEGVNAFLRDWLPGNDIDSSFALQASISDYSMEDPARGLEVLALSLEGGVDPVAIERILSGVGEAVSSGSELDWSVALAGVGQLVRRVAALDMSGARRLMQWRRAVDYGARLIEEGCDADAVPETHASGVWKVLGEAAALRPVWQEPCPDGDTYLDGITTAVNSDATGSIARALIAAGLWQYRFGLRAAGEPSEEPKAQVRAGVQKELVPILDRLIDDPGPNWAIPMAAIGERLPCLYLLVPEWLEDHVGDLLQCGLQDPVGRPTWTAYMVRNRLYDAVFHALRPWYVTAVKNAHMWNANLMEADPQSDRVTRHLAGHLVMAVLRGSLKRDEEDRLLEIAYSNLSASDWAHAYFEVVTDWRRGDGPVPATLVNRLVSHWEWRVSELGKRLDSEATVEEAKALGRFLHTSHIPDEDVLRLGHETARLARGRLMLDWEGLLGLAQSDPDGAFAIAETVLRASLKAPHPYVPVDDVKPLLALVLTTGDANTQDGVRELSHRLGERGYRDFKDLLDEFEENIEDQTSEMVPHEHQPG